MKIRLCCLFWSTASTSKAAAAIAAIAAAADGKDGNDDNGDNGDNDGNDGNDDNDDVAKRNFKETFWSNFVFLSFYLKLWFEPKL